MPGYGIGMATSAIGVATSRKGWIAAWPSAGSPLQTNITASDSSPTRSAGMNGRGGRPIRNEIVVSSSGALEATGTRARRTSLVGRHEERAAEDLTDRVQLVLEPGDDAEVPAAAADRPEEIGVRGLARDDLPAIGGDHLDSLERIDGEAVLAHQPADTAAQCQAADADGSGVTERRREAVGRGRVRVLAGGQARLGPREAPIDVDVETPSSG